MFSFVGYEFHLDSALVKPTQERWLKLQDFILHLKSKHVFDCKMFDVSNLNRDPTAAPGVDNTPQAVAQLRVPQQPAAPQPPRLVSRSGQLQEQGFSVEVAERIAAPQRSSTRTICKSKWALFEK